MSQDNPAFGSKRTIRISREALLQKAVDEPDLSWRVLTTLNIFRMLVAAALLGLFFSSGETRIFGDAYPRLFATTATIYLVFALIFSTALRQRWLPAGAQAVAQNLVDIAAVIVLIHTSGGISSGLGGLLIVFVGAGSLVMPRQYPALVGALATFAILGEQLFPACCRRSSSRCPWPRVRSQDASRKARRSLASVASTCRTCPN
jgi:hypothetical protein